MFGRMRFITSDRLLLRPWREDDADFLLDLESRWEVVRFLGPNPTTLRTREEALASIRHRRGVDHPVHGIWAITTRDGQLVGNLALVPVPVSAGQSPGTPPEVEIGWHLHPDAWGKGVRHGSREGRYGRRVCSGPQEDHRRDEHRQRRLTGRLPAARHDSSWPNDQVLRHHKGALRETAGLICRNAIEVLPPRHRTHPLIGYLFN